MIRIPTRFAAALLIALPSAAPAPVPALRGIDHIPVAVADLESAEARFRLLGFTIKPGRPHANGIRNGHAKFADGSYIELITAPAAVDALTARYRQHLAAGDGPAFLSLYVADTRPLLSALAAMGAAREDGSVVFPKGPLDIFFFGTRDRSPTDRPDHYRHANGARSLDRVWLAPTDPRAVMRMMAALGAHFRPARRCLPRCTMAQVAQLPGGEVVVLGAHAQRAPGRAIIGASIRVDSLARTRRALASGGIAIRQGGAIATADAIFVPPALANGLWLQFHER